jgi:hypothetical protein
MEKKQLLETLDALRAEVAQASEVDPEMLAELRRLTEEIKTSIDNDEDLPADEAGARRRRGRRDRGRNRDPAGHRHPRCR